MDFLKKFIISNQMEIEHLSLCLETAVKTNNEYLKKRKNELKILDFISKISTYQEKGTFEKEYVKFQNKRINSKSCFKDIFKINFDDMTENTIPFHLNTSTGLINKEAFTEEIEYKHVRFERNLINKTIIAFMIYFENFLFELIKTLMDENPKYFFDNCDKKILYKEIMTTDKDLKKYIKEKMVEDLMYDAISTIKNFFKQNSVQIDQFDTLMNAFNEIYLRRNIIIHNDAIVNEQYLSGVAEIYRNIKTGEELKSDLSYIKSSEKVIKKMGVLILFYMQYIMQDEDKKKTYLSYIQDIGFNYLRTEEWDTAKFIYQLLLKQKHIENADQISFMLNLLNAKKHLMDQDFSEELAKIDFTALDIKYKTARELLLNNDDEVLKLLKTAYPKSFSKSDILTWPIFFDFRKTKQFVDFKNDYKDEFNDSVFIKP